MNNCPLCKSEQVSGKLAVYNICGNCKLAYQFPFPEKKYESTIEPRGDLISDFDRAVNYNLARSFHHNHLKVAGNHLSLGSKYPIFAHYLQAFGHRAIAIDGIAEVVEFGNSLGVESYQLDFELEDISLLKHDGIPVFNHYGELLNCNYNSVDMLNVLEHLYHPVETLKKIANAMAIKGIVLIRVPDYNVPGIERDLTKFHYQIHPVIYTEESFFELLSQVNLFECYETYPIGAGQRDFLLRKK